MEKELASKQIAAIDTRGRMSFPAAFRNELGDVLYLTQDTDQKQCIVVYSADGYSEYCRSMREGLSPKDASMIMTYIGSVTHMVEPDKMGRITVPEELCKYAGLTCKSVAVIGTGTYAEIWDKERYEAYSKANNETVLAMILRKRQQAPQ